MKSFLLVIRIEAGSCYTGKAVLRQLDRDFNRGDGLYAEVYDATIVEVKPPRRRRRQCASA